MYETIVTNWKKIFVILIFILVGILSLVPSDHSTATLAQGEGAFIKKVRVLEADQTNTQNPAGLTFSPRGNAFHVINGHGQGQPPTANTDVIQLSTYGDWSGSARIAAAIKNPLNVAFDQAHNRLLIYQTPNKHLLEVQENADGTLNPNSITRHRVRHFGLQNPQGIAVDPASGHLFFLDNSGPQLVIVEPHSDGTFENALVSTVNLQQIGLSDVRGLAFDPRTSHIHLISLNEQKLYELTKQGEVITTRSLSEMELKDPQALVFAPSGDLTDATKELSLYIADSGSQDAQQSSRATSLTKTAAFVETETTGAIVELSFSETVVQYPESAYQSSLIQTIEAWQWAPPSPDTAGITYLNDENRLFITDSEVNEMPLYQGANLFKTTFTGNVISTENTLDFSAEPTGVAFKSDPNPNNERIFISDDSAKDVNVIKSGNDGLMGTADDVHVSEFETQLFNSADPEGLAYDSAQDHLFIVDGVNHEVYEVDPGANNIFDGVWPDGDDQVSQFDTLSLGLEDPEGITYNTQSGTLYIVGNPEETLFEVTTNGSLVQTIDISAANARTPAGLAFAPSSVNPLVMSIYITDRGIDNNSDPNENDGKIYEMTLPLPPGGPVPPTAIDDNASTAKGSFVTFDVTINDTDLNGNLMASSANTNCNYGSSGCTNPTNGNLVNNGDGSFTYTPIPSFTGNDSFVYEICDSSLLCDTATVTVTVFGQQVLYLSTTNGSTVAGINFQDEDILAYDLSTGTWSMYFDGSDVGFGLSGQEVNAFHINDDGSILISPEENITIPGIGDVQDHDILRFTPTSTGQNTSGSFELYFDGEDVNLENSRENIDAISLAPDGRLVISTSGSSDVGGGLKNKDEDLLIFTDTSLGSNTSGSWERYFDGSDVDLNSNSSEDVAGSWIDSDGNIYLSTKGAFSVSGLDGDGDDIFICVPSSLGSTTSCSSFTLFWDGTANGLNVSTVSDFTIVNTGPPVVPPTANDDNASTNEDTTAIINVAANDTDPGGNLDPASANTTCLTCTEPTNGTLVNNGDGSFDYTPNLNFNGGDNFVYKICNISGDCDTATVSIIVNPVADAPIANDDNFSTSVNSTATLNVAANDTDPDGDLAPNSANTICGSCTNPTNGTLANNGNGTFDYTPNPEFSGNDNFVYEVCDSLGACDTASVSISVDSSTPTIFETRVAASSDDAEENTTGDMYLGSSDLELVFDDDNQTVGIRFNGVAIPSGATITNATIQFQADEKNSDATALNIQGQADNNALTFNSSDFNISSRTRTTASIPWAPLPWTERGETGPAQQTPDIAAVIQEIIVQPGWTSGNSLVIIITGTGKRVAESYTGDSDGAPLLHVEYLN